MLSILLKMSVITSEKKGRRARARIKGMMYFSLIILETMKFRFTIAKPVIKWLRNIPNNKVYNKRVSFQ